jgi:hypothetical protein
MVRGSLSNNVSRLAGRFVGVKWEGALKCEPGRESLQSAIASLFGQDRLPAHSRVTIGF